MPLEITGAQAWYDLMLPRASEYAAWTYKLNALCTAARAASSVEVVCGSVTIKAITENNEIVLWMNGVVFRLEGNVVYTYDRGTPLGNLETVTWLLQCKLDEQRSEA